MAVRKLTMKKVAVRIMDIIIALMIVAKIFAAFYLLGLCGGLENETITLVEFLTKAIITLLFIFLG